jgi:hypothetical protein
MRRTLSSFLSGLGFNFIKPKQHVLEALERGASQQSLLQLEIPHDKTTVHHQHLTMTACSPKGLTLVSPTPFFMIAASWLNKSFLFRCLIQIDNGKPPMLHKFRSRIICVGSDKRTITIALPSDIVVMEQRRSVRITPRIEHLPNLVVWGVNKNQDGANGSILHHNVLLDLESGDLELRKTLLNVSAVGIRLALPQKVVAQNKEWLAVGRKLIVQMVFPGADFAGNSKHMLVAKICNARVEHGRQELGIQFLASRVSNPKPGWLPLDKGCCEQMAKVIHFLQVKYYSEAKKRLVALEGSISATAPEARRGRKNV